ncbi:MAG: DUF2459 domain-containing protein [Paracoccaceae bacterium]
MRWIWRTIRAAGLIASLLFVLHLVTMARNSDFDLMTTPTQGIPIWVVDHGYHSGLIVSNAKLMRAALELGRQDPAAAARLRWLASRYPDAEWIEIGWGDAAFYQQTPGIGDVDPWLALRALFWPTEAVLQVVPGWGAPEEGFPGSETLRIGVTKKGLRLLSGRLAETIPEPAPGTWLGPSLYGYGAFYPAELDYHLFRTCNHWVAWLLRGAGVPASPVPGTVSAGLMAELEYRVK